MFWAGGARSVDAEVALRALDQPASAPPACVALASALAGQFDPAAAVRAESDQPAALLAEAPPGTAGVPDAAGHDQDGAPYGNPYRVGPLCSTAGRAAFTRMVRAARAAIFAGEFYQVNLTHRLTARFEGCPRSWYADLIEHARPWHGAYLEHAGPASGETEPVLILASASPELFLRFERDADGPGGDTVTTRPMKGTRPSGADPAELDRSIKDRAELDMITDLMRNDLGRSCATGSVRVNARRSIERHASGVWQATSTVSGRLAPGVSRADAVRAAFPPGSVTGAPKVSALRHIDAAEREPRGFYCGAVGYAAGGIASLAVAIRTGIIVGKRDRRTGRVSGELRWAVGAGITAGSDPAAEWRETLMKARVLRRVRGQRPD